MVIISKSWADGVWWVVVGSSRPAASRVSGYQIEGPEDMSDDDLLAAVQP